MRTHYHVTVHDPVIAPWEDLRPSPAPIGNRKGAEALAAKLARAYRADGETVRGNAHCGYLIGERWTSGRSIGRQTRVRVVECTTSDCAQSELATPIDSIGGSDHAC